ncbi:unnamed protein product [Durusdinium trenchii]|uniref:Uncharacterized protein n=1 Tax=Durusdinium trenchii TaxID=1381693 RepID=A0ABP0KWX7_9DINO
MPPAKRPRQPGQGAGRQQRDTTQVRLLGAHDHAIEKLKAALMLILFLPKALHDHVEQAAKQWKDRSKPGEEHPDKCSCTCARLKALLEAIDRAMAGPAPVLVGAEECKTSLTHLVEVVTKGGAHCIVSDISLKAAASRSPEQSPYEITLTSSAEGHMMRTALLGVSQPNATPNTRDQPVKSWEVRAYRPRRGGLIRELQG